MQQIEPPKNYNIIHSLIIAALIIGAAIFGERVWQNLAFDKAQQAAINQSGAQFVQIYDDFWKNLNKYYYREDMDGIDWPAKRKEGILQAQNAKSREELFTIIQKQIDLFPVSHITIMPNIAMPKENGASHNLENGTFRLVGIGIVGIKRATKRLDIIEFIEPNSKAAQFGLKPGWWIKNINIEYGDNKIPRQLKALIIPLNIEDKAPKTNENGEIIGFFDKNGAFADVSTITPIEFEFDIKPIKNANPIQNLNINGAKYIRFDSFMSEIEIETILDEINSCPKGGIIFDLRRNMGGDMELMQRMISPLLPPHTLLMHTKSRSWSRTFHSSWFYKQCNAPLVVLIGPSSASAAEIVAQSLKHYKRATIMGRRSNGSVIGARDYVLLDGSLLQIPTLELFGADKKSIEGIGVIPDIEFSPEFLDTDPKSDELVLKAVEVIEQQAFN